MSRHQASPLVAALLALTFLGGFATPVAAAPEPGGGVGLGDVRHAHATPATPTRVVILIHGLDDGCRVWKDLLPALLADGHAVACFDYGGVESIGRAANLLAKELAALRREGIRAVDVVAHSMGGLVIRDVLTREDLYGGHGAGTGSLPSVDRVVMLATPNRGAPLARLRPVSQLPHRLVGALTRDGDRSFDADPARDLVPGSPFLRELAGRPTPEHTQLTIVAARMVPWTTADLEQCLSACGPTWLRACGVRTAACVGRVIRSLGDGIVPLDATRWAAVDDFVVVRANHASLVYRSDDDGPPPPAVPIVLDRLAPAP